MLRGKRLLSLLLCLVLVLSFFPTALADGEDEGIILEDKHDHEGEDQGMIVPAEAEPVGAIQESPEEEIDDDYAGNETLAAPETGDLVRVEFICDPEETIVTVYDPAQFGEYGEPALIEPEEDGSWLLYPREYLYDAAYEGYACAEHVKFEVDIGSVSSSGRVIIIVTLAPFGDPDAVVDNEPEALMDEMSSSLTQFMPRWPFASVGYNHYVRVVDNYSPSYSSKDHYGMDIAAARGDEVLAVESGKVVAAVNTKPDTYEANSWGNYVKIQHEINGKKYYSLYAHLQQGSVTVSVGDSVSKGTIIGRVGTSGSSDGPHLHLEMNEGTRWTQSFEYYKDNPSAISGVWFNSNSKNYSKHYSEWITNNCTPIVYSGSTYYVYDPSNAPSTYTVTYNANGGNWAPSSQTKTHGVDLTLATAHPARSSDSAGSYTVSLDPNGGTVEKTSYSVPRTNDYTFRNWNTKADGSGTSYEAGGTYSANASVTLYAQYDRTTRTSSIKLPTPSRNGAAFLGWATSPSASSGVTGSYTPPGNVTLYAIWSYETPKLWLSSSSIQLDVVTKPTQKINYYYSGDTANGYYLSSEIAYSSIPNVIQYSWGSGEECVIITGLRAGHAYLQISLVEYNTGNILYSALCEVTVTDPRSYTIRYDANGGYGAPASQTKTHNVDINLNGSEPKRDSEYGETLTLHFDANGGTVEPSEMTAQKITWYSFDSWNTARDGSGTKYYGGSSYSGNANLTLYAQWDSGTSSTSFVLPEPTRQGYRFLGWAAIPGGEPRYAAGAKVTLRDSGTIYAIWEAIRLPGDVNGDGVVNGTDLIRLRRYLAGENVEIVAENADVNGDGTINGMDLIRLRKYLAGEAVDLR